MRVGKNLVAGGGVERSPFGVLDARVGIERGFFSAAGVCDALFSGQRVNVAGVEIEVSRQRSKLRRIGNSAEWIFRSDLRQLQSRFQHAVEAGSGEITGMSIGGPLPTENAHADGLRPGFFEGLYLAQADERREFIAFANDALSGGGSARHGAGNEILREFFQVSFGLRFESCF